MNFPLHFLDDQLAVNIGVLLDAITSHRNQPKVCGNNDSIYVVLFETIPSLVGLHLFEANCPNQILEPM